MRIDQLPEYRADVRRTLRHNTLTRRVSILGLAAEMTPQIQPRLVSTILFPRSANGLSRTFHLAGFQLHPDEQLSHRPPR